jgi:uncharacterized protein
MAPRLIKLFSLLIFFSLVFLVNSIYAIPEPAGFVNDFADVLSPEFEEMLEEKLKSFSNQAGPEIAIVTINSLEGDTVENYAVELFNDWNIGKKENDNGVLFLTAISDKKMRIEVGYGAESKLNDAKAGRIIRDTIAPEFKNQDYETGIDRGTDLMITSLKGEPDNQAPETPDANATQPFNFIPFIFFAGVFSYLAAYFSRSKSWWAGGIVGFIIGLFASFSIAIILALLGFLLDYILSTNFKKLKKAKQPTGFWSSKGGFWTGGGTTSGRGFGGFGGGRSGGGGASGSW